MSADVFDVCMSILRRVQEKSDDVLIFGITWSKINPFQSVLIRRILKKFDMSDYEFVFHI